MVQEWRCRLIAQELGYGQRMDELFAGTHSVMAMKLILYREHGIMFVDVKYTILCGKIRQRVYTKLPRQDPRYLWWEPCTKPCTAPAMPLRSAKRKSERP